MQRFPDRFCQSPAIIIELTLLGDIARIKRVGIGLILISRAMAENDHVAAVAQGTNSFSLWRCALTARRQRRNCQEGAEPNHSNDARYHGDLLLFSMCSPSGQYASEMSGSAADGFCCGLIAGHFQNSETKTNAMMPMSRQMPAILVTVSFIQTPDARARRPQATKCRRQRVYPRAMSIGPFQITRRAVVTLKTICIFL